MWLPLVGASEGEHRPKLHGPRCYGWRETTEIGGCLYDVRPVCDVDDDAYLVLIYVGDVVDFEIPRLLVGFSRLRLVSSNRSGAEPLESAK